MTVELKAKVVAGVNEEVGARTLQEVEAWRDSILIDLIKAKQ